MKFILYLFSFLVVAASAGAQTKTATAPKRPIHKATIAGKTNGNISKSDLLNSKGVLTSNETHHITEFSMSLIGKDAEEMEFFNGKNGELTENMRAEIKGADSGSKISFESILCADSTNKTHKMNTLSFLIK